MIELQNIVKRYGDLTAVDNLSLKVNTGDVLGLLGPNGAGKSTTMKIITGFLIPDEGEVLIEGINIKDDLVSAKRQIGYMPENNPLYKEFLVEDAIKMALDLHSVPLEIRNERIDYVVKSAGLENVYYKPISELSKGYRQRVGLAQVLIHDPKILILDEPTEGLDPNQRAEIRNLIKALGKDRTVIISTHVMQEVEAMCNRVVIINHGKIAHDAPKDQLIKSKGGDLIKLKIKTKDKEKVTADTFKNIGATDVKTLSKAKGNFEFEITTKNSSKFYDSFSDLLRQNSWTIQELATVQSSLEDLFRELTHE